MPRADPITGQASSASDDASPAPWQRDHIDALDGLRFLAAVVVLFAHCWNVLAKPDDLNLAIRHSPLTIFLNGYGAVHLFFILSGFCLAGSAERIRKPADLLQFYVRRIFRIHPPYVYALLFAWLASIFYDGSRSNGGLTEEALRLMRVHLSPRQLLSYCLYPGNAAEQLSPAWTLAVEMNFSFLLPLMVWLSRRTHWALLILVSLYPLAFPGQLPGFYKYAFHFALGISIFEERTRLRGWASRLTTSGQSILLGIALGTFAAPPMLGIALAPDAGYLASGLFVSGLGGAMLLGAGLFSARTNRFLSARLLVYGGRRSYSFYLVHYPLVLLLGRMIHEPVGWLGGLAFTVVVFASTWIAATLSFRAIERPSIRAGNALCNLSARRVATVPQVSRLA
jgi:peptidoglycan/LPS O-acetylase OafA/YrhL